MKQMKGGKKKVVRRAIAKFREYMARVHPQTAVAAPTSVSASAINRSRTNGGRFLKKLTAKEKKQHGIVSENEVYGVAPSKEVEKKAAHLLRAKPRSSASSHTPTASKDEDEGFLDDALDEFSNTSFDTDSGTETSEDTILTCPVRDLLAPLPLFFEDQVTEPFATFCDTMMDYSPPLLPMDVVGGLESDLEKIIFDVGQRFASELKMRGN